MSEDADNSELFPDLPGQHLLAVAERVAKEGNYSGALVDKDVAKVQQIAKALAANAGIKRIAAAFGVSIKTVMGIRERHPELIATEKKEMSKRLGRLAVLAADNMEERLIAGTWKPTSVDLGILLDKKAQIDGDASLVIEHRHTVAPGVEDYIAKLEQMRKAAVIDVQSVGGAQNCEALRGEAGFVVGFGVVGGSSSVAGGVHGVAAPAAGDLVIEAGNGSGTGGGDAVAGSDGIELMGSVQARQRQNDVSTKEDGLNE